MAMAGGNYDVLLVVEHGLYPPKLEPKKGWHNRIYMAINGTYTRLSYNNHNSDNVTWNHYDRTRMTLTVDMKSWMGSKGVDPSKLG